MRGPCTTAGVLLICLSRLNAGQVPFVDHQPHNFGGLTSDSMGYEVPGAPIVYQDVADDITLSMANMVQQVVFWGFYNSNVEPVGDETIRVRFCDARPGDMLPGSVLYEQSFLNVPRAWTGRNVIAAAGGLEYRYEVLLDQPLNLDADTKYWLEIAQIGDPASSFRWEQSQTPPLTGTAFNNAIFPNWMTTVPSFMANAAFQLNPIPEPSIMALFGIGAFTMRFGRRRSWEGSTCASHA